MKPEKYIKNILAAKANPKTSRGRRMLMFLIKSTVKDYRRGNYVLMHELINDSLTKASYINDFECGTTINKFSRSHEIKNHQARYIITKLIDKGFLEEERGRREYVYFLI